MDRLLVFVGWLLLALLHVLPSVVLFSPSLTQSLYGVTAASESGTLIVHRGALFLAILTVALWAAFDPNVRRLGSVVLTLSLIGFLFVWWRSGMPEGLRTIAIADAIGLLPLFVVSIAAWRS